MKNKSILIISLMPLKPVTCGMQNTIHLLYKFLKEKKNKLIFYNINNSSVVDPVINLKFNKNILKRINKLTLKYDFDTIFVNTSKLLNIYQNFFFKKKKQFKVFLICHDLYYFRKNFFKNINIKDKTVLTKENEIRSLKKVDHILDFSDLEKKFMIKNKIDKHKLLNTFTPTKKTYKIYDSSASYDLLYVASNWQQNNINLKFAQKTLKLNTNNFKLLILGNLKYQKIKNKNIVFKKYSSDNMKKAKLGLAIIKYQTGRQTKIFEMMSIGLPVVTNVNLSNYGLVNGIHYIFQKNQDKLIKVVTSLLKDKKKREKISSECFYWSKANTFYKNSFKQLIKLSI
jgi:hypothetical protein